jgi:anti-anti-sigma factor
MDYTFSTEAIDGTEVSRISIEGELDIASVEQVEKAADAAIAARRPVVVDLAKCPFMDSTGLHWIVLVHQALTDEVGVDPPMAIVARSSGIVRLLSVTKIDERIPVFRTEDAALTALQAASSNRAVGPAG